LVGAALGLTAGASHAQSIDPAEFETTLAVGESVTINKTITLGAGGATTVDVFFLADNTGSMGGVIGNAQRGATAILDDLPDTYRFGAGRYVGDPVAEGLSPSFAYATNQALTFDKAAVQTGIDGWFARGGGDGPEGNFFGLQQVAETADWRPDAQRLVVWFGDAPSHTETVTEAEAIDALNAVDAEVVAFNRQSAGSGMDGEENDFFSTPPGQAQRVVDAVGGSLTNNFTGLSDAAFVTAVNNAISEATSTLDLFFASTYAGTGLDISFACTDALGCDDVEAGTSRTFDVTITGLEPGTYEFEVFARGVDAVETDRITVIGDGVVATPEPGTMLLLGAGLLGLGFVGYRREDSASA
jgi:hypothetical protein